MPTIAVIVAAAGNGQRFGGTVPKPYVRLAGKPLLSHVLALCAESPGVRQVIVAAAAARVACAAKLARRVCGRVPVTVIRGGASRTESVSLALAEIEPAVEIVLVHDAARPFATPGMVRACARAAALHGAAVCAVPCESTIKQTTPAGDMVQSTLDRRLLWQAQTPQGFRAGVLRTAYHRWEQQRQDFFDDAALVQHAGYAVAIVPGSRLNIKITTREDLLLAEAIQRIRQQKRGVYPDRKNI